MAKKDGFKHVDNAGASQADIKRGFKEGEAPETLDYCESIESMDDEGGFLRRGERSRQWER